MLKRKNKTKQKAGKTGRVLNILCDKFCASLLSNGHKGKVIGAWWLATKARSREGAGTEKLCGAESKGWFRL